MTKNVIPEEFLIREEPLPLAIPGNVDSDQVRRDISSLTEELENQVRMAETSLRNLDESRMLEMRGVLLELIKKVMDPLDDSLLEVDKSHVDPKGDRWIKRLIRARGTLLDALGRADVCPFEARHASPGRTEIIDVETRNDLPYGTVIDTVRRGYTWKDEILREAGVVVAKGSE